MMWLEGHTSRFKAIACMMGVYEPDGDAWVDGRVVVSAMGSGRNAVEFGPVHENGPQINL